MFHWCLNLQRCQREFHYYTEVSSFQEVGIEMFHCISIQRHPCFKRLELRFPLYIEVFSLQGVGIEGLHCIQRCPPSGGWNSKVSLYLIRHRENLCISLTYRTIVLVGELVLVLRSHIFSCPDELVESTSSCKL